MSVEPEFNMDVLRSEFNELVPIGDEPGPHRRVREIFGLMRKHIASLESQVGDLEDAAEDREEDNDPEDAIGAFLDVVERPTGTRDFTIPKTGESQRAILGLYDAIGRTL